MSHGAYMNSLSCALRICIPGATVEKMYKMMKKGTFAAGERSFFYIDVKNAEASEEDKLESELTIIHLDDYDGQETKL